MSPSLQVKRIDTIHTVMSFFLAFVMTFSFFTGLAFLQFLIIKGPAQALQDLPYALIMGASLVAAYLVFLVWKNNLLYLCLSLRGASLDVLNHDKQALGKALNFILQSRGVGQISDPDQLTYLVIKYPTSLKAKPVLTSLSFSMHRDKRIDLTREESDLLIATIAPQGGSWAMLWNHSLELRAQMKSMSAHDIMRFHKNHQDVALLQAHA